jgi:hypothetical protein
MLERRLRQMLGMPGQVHLAIAPDDPPVTLDQDRGVVTPRLPVFLGELGVAEVEADLEVARQLEQRLGVRARHLAFEELVDLGLVGHPPAREERRQGQLRKHDKLRPTGMRLAQQRHQPFHHRSAAVGEMNGAELGDGGAEFSGHSLSPCGEIGRYSGANFEPEDRHGWGGLEFVGRFLPATSSPAFPMHRRSGRRRRVPAAAYAADGGRRTDALSSAIVCTKQWRCMILLEDDISASSILGTEGR